jgi:hypothetical protein
MISKIFILVIIFCVYTNADGLWQELFVHDCEHNIRFAAGNGAVQQGIAFWGVRFASKFINIMPDTAKCHCPDLTQDELDTYFTLNFENLLRVSEIDDDDTYVTPDFPCEFDFTMDELKGLFFLDFSNTCNYDDYAAGDPCNFKVDLGDKLGAEIQFAIQKCPNEDAVDDLPYFSLTCSGDICQDFMAPCNDDSDCYGSNECTPQLDLLEGLDDVGQYIMNFTGWFNEHKDSASDYGFEDVGILFMDSMWTSVNGWLGRSNKGVGTGFCGMNHLQYNGNSSYAFDLILDQILENHLADEEDPDDPEETNTFLNFFAWDGVLDNGDSATDANRVDGSAFFDVTVDIEDPENGVTLLYAGCDGKLAINPNSPLSMQGQAFKLHRLLEAFYEAWSGPVKERDDFTDEEVNYQNNPLNFGLLLDALTGYEREFDTRSDGRPVFDSDDHFSDIVDFFQNGFLNGSSVELPATCSAETWYENGRCTLEYEYIGELFTTPISLVFNFEECIDYPHALPKFTLQCIGDICEDLAQPYVTTPCAQDNDCEGDASCTIIDDFPLGTNVWAELLYDANVTKGNTYQVFIQYWLQNDASVYTPGFHSNTSAEAGYANWFNNLSESNWTYILQKFMDNSVYYQLEDEGHTKVDHELFREYEIIGEPDVESDWWFSYLLYPIRIDPNYRGDEFKPIEDISYAWGDCLTIQDLPELIPEDSIHQDTSYYQYEVICVSDVWSWKEDSYYPCRDGSYDVDGIGCEVDECSHPTNFHWDLYNFLRTSIGQEPSDVLGEYVGFCETEWQTGVDTSNINTWSDDITVELDDGTLIFTGLLAYDIDPCEICDGGCVNGVCEDSGAIFTPQDDDNVRPFDSPASVARVSSWVITLGFFVLFLIFF